MRNIRLIIFLLTSVVFQQVGWADVPFTPTTIENGEFAFGTKWYTIEIGTSGYVISGDEEGHQINLTTSNTKFESADLWCFVGNNTDGYKIYNKQTGTQKVLASPKSMSGTNGSTAYVVLKDTNDLIDYTDLWLFADSDDLGIDVNGQYMYQKRSGSNVVSNRNNVLVFNTNGTDSNSTLVFKLAETQLMINATTGTFVAGNSAAMTWCSKWQSYTNDPQISLSSGGYNNMKTSDGCLVAYVGSVTTSQDYTISTTHGYIITDYTFEFIMYSSSGSITVSGGEQEYVSSIDYQTLSVSGLNKQDAIFTLSGANRGILIRNFIVTVRKADDPFEVFSTPSDATIPYRIPAVAQAQNGNVIAIADYRHGGGEIGSGEIDLHGRILDNNGAWGDVFTIAKGSEYTDTCTLMHTGFSHPAIVADRESNRMLLMCCSGNTEFTSGTREKHQGIVRFYSEDGGQTWSSPTEISETIYSQFDTCKIGSAASITINSGRILQSSTVKIGEYYRIYCAALFKDTNNIEKNYVLYSDDFGNSWKVLGGVNVAPIPYFADEANIEELPDGSILISLRSGSARSYNIYTFSNSSTAKGSWDKRYNSTYSNDNDTIISTACKGDVLVVPAHRISDGQSVYVALQSVPLSSKLLNVGIYYKELSSLADFVTPEELAENWDGMFQVSHMGSAYSTMSLLENGTIGFLYEEETFGSNYTIVYNSYTLDHITDNAYIYDSTVNKDSIVAVGVADRYAIIEGYFGENVGNLVNESKSDVTKAYETYLANPSKDLYEKLHATVENADRVKIETSKLYRLRNCDNSLYLQAPIDDRYLRVSTLNEEDKTFLFEFVPVSGNSDIWNIHNEGSNVYISHSIMNTVYVESSLRSESLGYIVYSHPEGYSNLLLNDSGLGIHNAICSVYSSSMSTLQNSTFENSGAYWYIEPTDFATGIEYIESEANDEPETYYDLSGRRINQPTKGVYVTADHRKVYVK